MLEKKYFPILVLTQSHCKKRTLWCTWWYHNIYENQTQTCYFPFIDMVQFKQFNCWLGVIKKLFPRGNMIEFPLDIPVCFQLHVILFWKWQCIWAWLPSIWNISFWSNETKPLFLHTAFSLLANYRTAQKWHDWNPLEILQASQKWTTMHLKLL